MSRYTVYSSPKCPWCVKVINLMANLGLDIDVIPIKLNSEAITRLMNLNLTTVPQVFQGDFHIGGYEDFLNYAYKKGMLTNRGE